jgi:Transposase and inactivated derivatives
MGRKAKILKLTSEERQALKEGYKSSGSGVFSQRCHIILLKSGNRSSKEIGEIVGVTDQAVNNWVKRYKSEGLSGLFTKPGQGRKPILDPISESLKVREVVESERQRLKNAQAILEKELGKEFSVKTLQRFLKNLGQGGSEFV